MQFDQDSWMFQKTSVNYKKVKLDFEVDFINLAYDQN